MSYCASMAVYHEDNNVKRGTGRRQTGKIMNIRGAVSILNNSLNIMSSHLVT